MRVAIVGAGIAGLTARLFLRRGGMAVDTFDKGRGLGGRASRRRAGEFQFDHGAQYFTARDPEFLELATRWVAAGSVQPWEPRIGVLSAGRWTPKPAASDRTRRYVGVPGMNQPARNLQALGDDAGAAEDAPVRTGVRIIGIAAVSDSTWTLKDDAGNYYPGYDAVILTVPVPQVRDILKDGGNGVVPAVVCGVTEKVILEPCWAVMLVFDPRLDLPWDAAFVQDNPLSWIARNGSKPGRPEHDAWVLHAGPSWTREHLEDEAETVASGLLREFLLAAGLNSEQVAHATASVSWRAAHRWRYARPAGAPPPEVNPGYLWDGESRLGLCGDWCVGGRLEGAFVSGRELAWRVLDTIR